MEPPIHDVVSEAIKRVLLGLEADGKGAFVKDQEGDLVRLKFGDSTVVAETYEIALVRLGASLMNTEEFSGVLVQALRGPMESSPQ